MMSETQIPGPHAATTADERAAALELMERVLREGRPMAAEYPLVFGPEADGEIEVVEENGRPVAACAWLLRDLVTPSANVPAAFVGSVATQANCRGKGYGTDVVGRAIERAAEAGAALAMLWADDPLWYQNRGWVPFGTERVHVIDESWAFLLPEPADVRVGSERDTMGIHALYETHVSRVARTEAETRTMLGVPAMRTVVQERDGEILGYACMGRGEDLMNVVHEWGGEPEAVLSCFSKLWADAEAERMFVMFGETEVDLGAYFDFVKSAGATGTLCMARVASAEAVARVFDEATPEGVTAKSIEGGEEPVVELRSSTGAIRLTGYEIVLALCPPKGDRRVTDVVEQELGCVMEGLPIRPFVWGLDGI